MGEEKEDGGGDECLGDASHFKAGLWDHDLVPLSSLGLAPGPFVQQRPFRERLDAQYPAAISLVVVDEVAEGLINAAASGIGKDWRRGGGRNGGHAPVKCTGRGEMGQKKNCGGQGVKSRHVLLFACALLSCGKKIFFFCVQAR